MLALFNIPHIDLRFARKNLNHSPKIRIFYLLFVPIQLTLVVFVNQILVNDLIQLQLAVKNGEYRLSLPNAEYGIEVYLLYRLSTLELILDPPKLDQIELTVRPVTAQKRARHRVFLLWLGLLLLLLSIEPELAHEGLRLCQSTYTLSHRARLQNVLNLLIFLFQVILVKRLVEVVIAALEVRSNSSRHLVLCATFHLLNLHFLERASSFDIVLTIEQLVHSWDLVLSLGFPPI